MTTTRTYGSWEIAEVPDPVDDDLGSTDARDAFITWLGDAFVGYAYTQLGMTVHGFCIRTPLGDTCTVETSNDLVAKHRLDGDTWPLPRDLFDALQAPHDGRTA